MTPHIFLEGGGMVTGTHDVLTARRLIIDHYLFEQVGVSSLSEAMQRYGAPMDEHDYYDVVWAMQRFASWKARREVGRVVPARPDHPEGYSWFWHSGYKLGNPGVTRAVVWLS